MTCRKRLQLVEKVQCACWSPAQPQAAAADLGRPAARMHCKPSIFTGGGTKLTCTPARCRLSGNEAAVMDPQGRVLLETTAGALADAAAGATGPAPAATGVYVGVMHMEYIQYMTGTCELDRPLQMRLLSRPASAYVPTLMDTNRYIDCNIGSTGLGVKVGPAVSTGNGMDFLVGRLSYTFGLTGA
jgi:Beta-ketoacyl synthase, N-terminal domain